MLENNAASILQWLIFRLAEQLAKLIVGYLGKDMIPLSTCCTLRGTIFWMWTPGRIVPATVTANGDLNKNKESHFT